MVYTALSDDSSTLSQFTRREAIVVTTNGTNTPSNYQVKLTITYEYEMQSDFDDIRFNTKDGRYIDYWIESYIASTSAVVWLELPDAITDPGSDTVWMYYGNDGLSDGGNGDDTFLFFDDFNDASIDTAKWDVTANVVESGGLLTITGQGAYRSAMSDNTFGTNTAIRTRTNMGLGGYGNNQDLGYGAGHPHEYGYTTDYPNANTYHTRYSNSTFTSIGGGYTGYHIWDVIRNGTTSTIYTIDNSIVDTKGSSGSTAYNIGFSAYANGTDVISDWILIRKSIANEPITSYGPVFLDGLLIQRWLEFETIDSISIGAKTFKCSLENTDNAITNSYESFDTAVIYIDGTTVFNGRIEEIIPNESEATIELAGKDYMGDLIGEYIIENYGISQDLSNNEAAGSDVVIEITDTTGFEVDDEIKVEDDNDAETAIITAVVTNTSITVATLTNSYTTAANAKVTVGRPGSYIVNDLVLKYGSSMTRVGIQTSTNKFIILFKGITAFDAIQYISDSEEFEFGQDQAKDFFYQPRTFEDSGLSIDLDSDDVMEYSFPRPGYEIINRVDIYGGTSGGVQVAIRVEDPTSQNYYGITKGMTIIDEKITTEHQAQARANAILSEKAWVIQIGELSVLGYETLQAGQLVSLSNFDSIDDGPYLVTEKMHLEPPGNTLIKVAEYRAELEDVIIDLLKRMRAREKEAMDEDAFQTKFLNFYVTSLNADTLSVIQVDINDGYIAAHKTNSLAGRGYDGVGGNQLKAGRYQTETVIV